MTDIRDYLYICVGAILFFTAILSQLFTNIYGYFVLKGDSTPSFGDLY